MHTSAHGLLCIEFQWVKSLFFTNVEISINQLTAYILEDWDSTYYHYHSYHCQSYIRVGSK
jgi:hypothetical protein